MFQIQKYVTCFEILHFQNFGTPRHSGLYYSMGSALAIEGLMSACYHVCPNHSNFQFGKYIKYLKRLMYFDYFTNVVINWGFTAHF